ncbi:MAG: CocE/NonD family hydrolase [Acidimicrobiales bacterium]
MTYASRIVGTLAKLPPARTGAIAVDHDMPAEMPDGVTLFADRWYPADSMTARPPVVLLRTPYGRRQWAMIGRLFAERGYQVVIQSCRGTFGSGGEWAPFRNERADGRATLDWVASQPWFSGELATFGPSYLGLTQWAIAEDPPSFLKGMALAVTASKFRDAVVYPSESFALETALSWMYQVEYQERGPSRSLGALLASRRALRAARDVRPVSDADTKLVGHHVEFFQDWLKHEKPDDTWWEPVDFGQSFKSVPPTSLVAGWYDIFLPSQLDDYQALRAAGRTANLTVGPWHHVSPGGAAASLRDGLELFESQFGGHPDRSSRSAVRVFVMGARRWVELPDWPPPFVEQRWHLGLSGRLQGGVATESAPDRFRYDPVDPTPGIGGPSLNWSNAGRKDQRAREDRADVLTYTSETLAKDLTVIGPLRTELHVRSTLEHTDFFVRLCGVSPRGRSTNLSDGIVRLRPGDVTKSPDGSLLLQINMWPTANTFKRGHRIRLQVSSGAHPLFIRNPGTGEPLASATSIKVADQEVFHDAEHPSALVLPVSNG